MSPRASRPPDAPPADPATLRSSAAGRAHARFGWTLLAGALLFGTVLEALEAFRWSPFTADAWRSRLWALAHFHGAALGLLNLIYVPWADAAGLSEGGRRWASRTLRGGCALLPLGFLLGGVHHPEGDPAVAILLVPVGAVLIGVTAFLQVKAAWSARDG